MLVAASATSGNRTRRDCLPASRAVARHLASAFAPRSPFHWVMQREADHGTIASTPTSVMVSTASSPRSPLGSACTTVSRGVSTGSSAISPSRTISRSLPSVPSTSPAAQRPAPSVRTTSSPARSRFTETACRPSGPSSTWRPVPPVPKWSTTKTGAVIGHLPPTTLSGRRPVRRPAPPPAVRRAAHGPSGGPVPPTAPGPARRRPSRRPCAAARSGGGPPGRRRGRTGRARAGSG